MTYYVMKIELPGDVGDFFTGLNGQTFIGGIVDDGTMVEVRFEMEDGSDGYDVAIRAMEIVSEASRFLGEGLEFTRPVEADPAGLREMIQVVRRWSPCIAEKDDDLERFCLRHGNASWPKDMTVCVGALHWVDCLLGYGGTLGRINAETSARDVAAPAGPPGPGVLRGVWS